MLPQIEQLEAHVFVVSGTVTGIARELILTWPVGDNDKALVDRLMLIERRLADELVRCCTNFQQRCCTAQNFGSAVVSQRNL